VIIVVGVLTALAAEQVVEQLHWRHTLHAAQELLLIDAKSTLGVSAEREAEAPCLAKEFRQLRDVLDIATASGRLPPIQAVYEPTREAWVLGSYPAISAGQLAPHMSHDEYVHVASAELWSEFLVRHRDVEVHDWTILRGMEGPGRSVSQPELAILRTALNEAIYEANLMRGGARGFSRSLLNLHLLSPAAAAGSWKEGLAHGHARPVCAPDNLGDTERILDSLEKPADIPQPN
jgi:hypothetical protein